jgi:DNA-binding HxlR family transcriptional regulator
MNQVVKSGLSSKECSSSLGALEDALYAIGGKWKLKVIIALKEGGSRRFNELQRTVTGISARVLSNELKELEMNGFVKRTVHTQTPVVVEYELTDYSESLDEVLRTLVEWGTRHRDKIRKR